MYVYTSATIKVITPYVLLICMTKTKDKDQQSINKKQFDKMCCTYMAEFGFEWREEFTLNGA